MSTSEETKFVEDYLSGSIIQEKENPISKHTTFTGTFKIPYNEYFQDRKKQSNFCKRNKVIIDFPRQINSPCKINLNYQYQQLTNKCKNFIKIVGACENGPCRHIYIIKSQPEDDDICSVSYEISGVFANNNLTTLLHNIVSSTPLKGENRDRLSKLIAEKGNVFAYTQTRNESSSAEINSLNDTSCISPSVLRKVASESNHSLNFEDIKQAILNRKMQEFNYYLKIPSFIRNIVQEPYSVYYYLESQLQSFCTTSASSSWEHPATV